VASSTGIAVQRNKAIVGANAFAHESGIHQDGILKQRLTYEIMDAKDIGLSENQLVLGKHSGRHALKRRMIELGYDLSDQELIAFFERFKELADKKKEVFDEDLLVMMEQGSGAASEVYTLDHVQATSGSGMVPTAAVRLIVAGKPLQGTGTGDGPVDAVYQVIGALVGKPLKLTGYAIKAITGGTDAQGEVTVQLVSGNRTVTGRGAHTDIIVASAKAYVNALNRMSALENKRGARPAAASKKTKK
jgi:2-isopropylmalate synthase